MAELAPIKYDDFEAVYEAYLRRDDDRILRDRWKRLFTPACGQDTTADFGYMLLDKGKIVGMIGMYFSRLVIDGNVEKFCNLHSWSVDPEYRGYSMALMRPALNLNEYTITDFTPTPPVRKIETRLGFQNLDSTVRILPKAPSFRFARSISRQASWNEQIPVEELDDPARILLDDCRLFGLESLLVQTCSTSCFLICCRVTLHWRPYCYILYASDPAAFAAHNSIIRKEIFGHMAVSFVAIDDRAVSSHPIRNSFCLPRTFGQLFRSRQVRPKSVWPLYSEVSALGLTTFPSVHRLGRDLRNSIFRRHDQD